MPVTHSALTAIARSATSLSDHFSPAARPQPGVVSTEGRSDVEKRLQIWKKNLAGSTTELAKRLQWAGSQIDAIAPLLSNEPAPRGSQNLNIDHLNVLVRAYGDRSQDQHHRGDPDLAFESSAGDGTANAEPPHLNEDDTSTTPAADASDSDEKRFPFASLYYPIVAEARHSVISATGAAYHRLTPKAHLVLERGLIQRLARINARCLYAEFSTMRAQQQQFALTILVDDTLLYRHFVSLLQDGKIWEYFQKYPVAARLTARVTHLWIETVCEFIHRLDQDWDALETTFADGARLPAVTDIHANLSDPHGGGRSVFIPHFGVRKIVYKPRNVGLDAFFGRLVEWVNAQNSTIELKTLTILSRDEYGWIEFAETKDCDSEEDVTRYFERCGALLAIAYALNGSDFHFENLIPSGAHPVLIDMEALIGPRFKLDGYVTGNPSGFDGLADHFVHSVLKVGMLPNLKIGADGVVANVAGIGGQNASEQSFRVPIWIHVNTDRMAVRYRTVQPKTDRPNTAYFHGEPVNPQQYVGEIVRGFNHLYRLLVDHRAQLLSPGGLIDQLGPEPVRFIFRDTSLYGGLIERSLHPRFLQHGADRSIELDLLARPFLACEQRPQAWPLLAAEQAAIDDLDVPIFTVEARSRSLKLHSGVTVEECFERSAFEEAVDRLQSLCDSDRRHQTRLIQKAMRAERLRGLEAPPTSQAQPSPSPRAFDAEEAIDHACEIGNRILDTAIEIDAGTYAWFTTQYLAPSGRYRVNPTNYSLFDGTCGIAVFFSALYAATGNARWHEAARATLASFVAEIDHLEAHLDRRSTLDVGAGTGLSSVAYGLLRAGTVAQDADLIDCAATVARTFTDDRLAKCDHVDLVGGLAGAVAVLSSIYDETRDARIQDNLRAALRRLLQATANANSNLFPPESRTGLAHGRAGIALALVRCADALPDLQDRCRSAFESLMSSELTRDNIAQAQRAESRASWSRGTTGLGLVCVHGGTRFPTELCSTDNLNRCLDTVAQQSIGDTTWGTGAASRAELLYDAARLRHRPGLLCEARNLASAFRSVTPPSSAAKNRIVEPGLFLGLSGTGYTLLRIAQTNLPSILTWQ